jgi:hypothetical protein
VNTTAQDEITGYVDGVRDALVGLPEATRRELIEDLPEHLAEVLADGGGPLVERLGDPSVYAAELRSAAGFVGGFPDPPPTRDRFMELRATVGENLRIADVRVGPLLGYDRASDFFSLLRPAWWVLRGYLAAMVLAYVLDDSGQPIGLLPRIGGSEVVALLLLAGAILGSLWLGRRTARLAPLPRFALRAGTLLLVIVALTLFSSADSSTRGASYQDVQYDNPYGHVEDVYVYDQQGRLLHDVRLFDQNGQPIQLGYDRCVADVESAVSANGSDLAVYPFCPELAPFQVPPVDGSPAATPPADPAAGSPTPTVPGATATPDLTAGPSASEPVPAPTGSVRPPSPSVSGSGPND